MDTLQVNVDTLLRYVNNIYVNSSHFYVYMLQFQRKISILRDFYNKSVHTLWPTVFSVHHKTECICINVKDNILTSPLKFYYPNLRRQLASVTA